jgi:hypothetical protein
LLAKRRALLCSLRRKETTMCVTVLIILIVCFVVGLAVVLYTDAPEPTIHPPSDPIQEIHRIGFEAHQAINRASDHYLQQVQDLVNKRDRR